MSIHVTVSSNPVHIGRGRVLLTDIETAKKNEWLRRRKIRLQQVRQQARDLAHSVRKKVSGEENVLEKNEEEQKTEDQNKFIKEQITSLQHEFQNSVSEIGTGHHLASIRTECEALAREKEELREALAKARGAIAEERLKAEKSIQKEKSQVSIERKKMARQIEDLRSTLISNLPEAKSSVSLVKQSTTKVQIHRSDEPNEEEEVIICKQKVMSPTRKVQTSNKTRPRPAARSSLSPPRTVKQPACFRRKKSDHYEENSSDEESDDSDVTWPPRSARVTKEPIQPVEPPRVRFYDHNSRVVKNSPRPSYCVKQMDPYEQPDMGEAIAEEEEATVRKENLDIMARREKMIRGNKALRKERSKKEAEKFLKEIREIHKKEKIKMAVNRTYPSEAHMSDYRRKEIEKRPQGEMTKSFPVSEGFVIKKPMSYSGDTNGLIFDTCGVKISKVDSEALSKLDLESSAESDDFFEELVNKLKIERAKKQHELETKFVVKEFDDDDIPNWVKTQETAGPSGIGKIPAKQDRAVSPVKHCSCCSRCTCGGQAENNAIQYELEEPKTVVHSMPEHSTVDVSKENTNDDEHANILSKSGRSDKFETKIEEKYSNEEKNISQGVSVMSESLTCSSVGVGVECASAKSSQSETVESSLTFEGIKVTVKVSEKGKKKKKDRLSGGRDGDDRPETTDKHIQTSMEPTEESPASRNMSWNNRFTSTEATSSGSTSYLSPPSKLSPAHQSLLRAILTKIDAKNKNPRLHQYIKKVLEMSRNSIDQLPVSSVSDVSISSSVFDYSRNKRPQSLDNGQKVCRYNVSCQANSSCSDDSTTKEEMLKFSELAENYAHRLQDLASMMERMRMLPDTVHRVREGEDSSAYMSPPPEIHQSVRLSNSVRAGVYPSKLPDESVHRASEHRASPGLPPSHIHPHPSAAVNLQHSTSNNHQSRRNGTGWREGVPHELSTIQEGGESQRPETPQPGGFDPDVSSIRGSPRQPGGRDSTGSSLCLLDDQDISSWLGSSSDDFEEVFKSLGIAWALPTVRKTRQSQKRTSGSQTSSRSTGCGQYSHSTPLGPSPAKARDGLPSHSKNHPPLSADSDSLTPPSLSLNLPKSVLPRERNSR